MTVSNDRARQSNPFTVPTPLGGLAVRVARQPAARCPALLLLHANPGDSRDFAAVLPALAREATVVTVDWPGYGQSTAPHPHQLTAEGLVAVAEQVLDALTARGIHRVTIIGNSVGGSVAVRVAQRRASSVASLILVDPAGFTPRNALVRGFCRYVMGNPTIARHLVIPVTRAALSRIRTSSARHLCAGQENPPERPAARGILALWRSFADPSFDLTTMYSVPVVPTLLIWGRRDPILPAALDGRRARRVLPHARFVLLPTGHEPFNERPEAFLDQVVPFLRRHAGSDNEIS